MLDFPDSPTDGQIFNAAGVSWMWDGTKWTSVLSTGGPFLPLAGGTISPGPLNVVGKVEAATFETYNYRTQTGGVFNTALGIYGELSGARTSGNQYFAGIKIISDTMDAGGAGIAGLAVVVNSGTPSGVMGGRGAIDAQVNFTGAPGNKAAGYGNQFIGVSSYSVASGSVGGDGTGGPYGDMWGGIMATQLEAGATWWNSAIGCEINVGVASGANAAYVYGASVVLGTHNQAPQEYDALIGLGMLSRAGNLGLKNGIIFGGPGGWWPIHASGSLITTKPSFLSGGPAYAATHGVDLTGVTFSGTAFRSTGFSVDGTGALNTVGLTASSPSGNDPLHVTVANGNYARTNYTVTGTRSWTVGVFPTGGFAISDESVGARLAIATSGAVSIPGHVALAGGVDFGSVLGSTSDDVSKHISLNGGAGIGYSAANGFNLITGGGGYFDFRAGGVSAGSITVAGLNMVGAVSAGNGLHLGNVLGSGPTDVTKHLEMYVGAGYGLGVTAGQLNYNAPTGAIHAFYVAAASRLQISAAGLGFNGTAAVVKPTVTGSKGANAALASLLTALASYGLVTDSST